MRSKPGHFSLSTRRLFSIRPASRREELCGRSKVKYPRSHTAVQHTRDAARTRCASCRVSQRSAGAPRLGQERTYDQLGDNFSGLECPPWSRILAFWHFGILERRKAEDISRGSLIFALEEEEMWKGEESEDSGEVDLYHRVWHSQDREYMAFCFFHPCP
jgi:hypothetical protein